ncbi:MAG: YidC/Oxa1 family membrane protein insertase [Clostridiales bacterium]|nr:YidC/Oxa1 family membrane protein insertase [Clostridiales bacterium]
MTSALLATASNTFIIGPVAKVFGMIMNGLFEIGIHNIGVNIIVFTIIVYTLMLPLTIRQQKFSKMTALVNPEIQEIQKKYRNKKDQASQLKMQEETKAVYDKYGVSMSSGCLTTLIQFPILLGFYKVIYNVPAYVSSVKNIYNQFGLVEMIKSGVNAEKFIKLGTTAKVSISEVNNNTIIDVLWKLQDKTWTELTELGSKIDGFSKVVSDTRVAIAPYTNFFGLNIAESPMNMFSAGISGKQYGLCVVAILIPIVSALTQYFSMKLMPTASDNSAAGSQMKMMNAMMPLMSLFFVFTLPFGVGIYWIVSAVYRSGQQIVINRKFKNMDVEKIIEKNKSKAEKKAEKRKKQMASLVTTADSSRANSRNTNASKIAAPERKGQPKAGSLAAKANMVQKYNESHK